MAERTSNFYNWTLCLKPQDRSIIKPFIKIDQLTAAIIKNS